MIEIKGHIAGDRAYEISIMVASLVTSKNNQKTVTATKKKIFKEWKNFITVLKIKKNCVIIYIESKKCIYYNTIFF